MAAQAKADAAAARAGKTLIARQIGKMLNGKEPKIVNGPEVLNKYVGASEENVRNLFKVGSPPYAITCACAPMGCPGDGQHVVAVHGSLRHVAAMELLNEHCPAAQHGAWGHG